MLADLTRFFSIYLVLLFSISLTGYIVSLGFKHIQLQGAFTQLFFRLFIGTLFIITVFAVFKTRFQTVCIFLPLVFLCTFYRRGILLKANTQSTDTKSKRLFFYLAVAGLALLSFMYFAGIVFKSGSFHFDAMHYDVAAYGELSAKLAATGIENKWFMFFTNETAISGIEPYHYLECWLNAIPFSIFNTNALLSFYLLTYPLLVFITLTGICALIEHFRAVKGIHVLLALMLLFTGAIHQVKSAAYSYNMMTGEIPLEPLGEKFAVYYPFFLLGLLLVLSGYLREALVWLLSACIVSATLVPALLLFYFCSLPFLLKDKSYYLPRLILFFGLYFCFFWSFAAGNYSSSNAGTLFSFTDLQADAHDLSWFKLSLSNLLAGFARSLGYFAAAYFYVFVLIAVLLYKRTVSLRPLLYALLFCLSGLVAASFFYKMGDSHQLFTNTLPLLHTVTICFIVLLLFGKAENRGSKLAGWLLLVMLFTNSLYFSLEHYSNISAQSRVADSYLLQVKGLTADAHKGERIGFVYSQQDQDRLFRHPEANYLYHLSYLGLNPVPYRLSLREVNYADRTAREQEAAKRADDHELFRVFSEKQPASQHPDSLKASFIRQHHIRYLLTGPTTALPAFLNAQNSTIVRDPNTGIRFIRVDNLQIF